MRRLFLFLLLAAVSAQAAEEAARPEVTAETSTFQGSVLEGQGNFRLELGNLLLTADTGRYDFATRQATVSGNVVLTRGPLRLFTSTLSYSLADGSFTSGPVRAGSYPWYAEGSAASGTADSISIDDALVTYREPGDFAPTGRADSFTVFSNGRVQARGASLGIGSSLPIRLPRFTQSLDQPLLSQVTLTAGYREKLGLSVVAGLELPVLPGLQAGAEVGIHTARGVMLGPIADYGDADHPDRLRGSLRTGYINDHGNKQTDVLGRPVPENRGYVTWSHWQRLRDGLTLNARGNYWSDSEIVRDFDPNNFTPVQDPDNFAEITNTGTNYLLSLFGRFQPNRFSTQQQRLPELTYDLLQREIRPHLYEQFHASAAHLREDPPAGTGPVLQSDRFDAFYELRRPITHADWLTVTPVAGVRFTSYSNTRGAALPGETSRTLGELGFDAALHTSATFNYRNDRWGINGLRHLLTPVLSYRYIPRADKDNAWIPAIDRNTFTTYLPPLGFQGMRNLDTLSPVETLRVGIDNTLQTRDGEYGSRDLLVFNLAADFNYKRPAGAPDISEVHTELSFTPASWFRFDLYDSFAPQSFTLRQLNTALTISDGDAWSLRFANHFLRSDTEQYAIEGTRRLNEVIGLQARLRYDARQRRFDEQSYGITQNLADTWQIAYTATVYDGPRRESSFGFSIRVRSIGF